MKINLNDQVLVTLTPLGLTHLRKEAPLLKVVQWKITLSLWELMAIYGPEIRIGFDTHFFEGNDIQLVDVKDKYIQ